MSSPPEASSPRPGPGPFLALDTGSPVVSVALFLEGAGGAERTTEATRSSRHLLGLVEEVLGEAGCDLADLDGAVALSGPGSFTGLRVGLATLYGLHQATGLRVAALPTLRVLAETAPPEAEAATAVVDGLRGEWFVQTFHRDRCGHLHASEEATRVQRASYRPPRGAVLVGFTEDEAKLGGASGVHRPPPLAAVAGRLAAVWHRWDPADLLRPRYLREPAVSPPATG